MREKDRMKLGTNEHRCL